MFLFFVCLFVCLFLVNFVFLASFYVWFLVCLLDSCFANSLPTVRWLSCLHSMRPVAFSLDSFGSFSSAPSKTNRFFLRFHLSNRLNCPAQWLVFGWYWVLGSSRNHVKRYSETPKTITSNLSFPLVQDGQKQEGLPGAPKTMKKVFTSKNLFFRSQKPGFWWF